jgi:AhpD family alkylhydroperoxidase
MLSLFAMKSLARALARWPQAKGRGLDPLLREEIILRVSSVNACPVCSDVHVRAARGKGLSEARIVAAQALRLDGFDERRAAALRYAELRTLQREADDPAAVARFEALFDAAERAAVRATVDLFTFTNRFNNTWERVLPGAAERRRGLGR